MWMYKVFINKMFQAFLVCWEGSIDIIWFTYSNGIDGIILEGTFLGHVELIAWTTWINDNVFNLRNTLNAY